MNTNRRFGNMANNFLDGHNEEVKQTKYAALTQTTLNNMATKFYGKKATSSLGNMNRHFDISLTLDDLPEEKIVRKPIVKNLVVPNNNLINIKSYENINLSNNVTDFTKLNLNKIYIIVNNHVLTEGYIYKTFFESNNIISEVVNLNGEIISDTIYRDVLDNNDKILLIFGVTTISNPRILYNLKHKCLIYQIEQKNMLSASDLYVLKDFLKDMPNIIEFSHNNDFYSKKIDLKLPLIQLQTTNTQKDIDILFYGSLSTRRKNILKQLYQFKKYKIKYVYNTFGNELLNLINRSKIVLNLHSQNDSFLEIFRINLALSFNTHIVTENPIHKNEKYLYDLYKKIVFFIPQLDPYDNNNYNNLSKLIDKLLTANNINLGDKTDKINIINNISQKILFENLNVMDSTINNLRKSNLDETLFHKYYLKLETTDNQIKYNIIKTNISDYFIKRKYYAHLHCYDISKFNEIYGEYIDTICIYFSVIITYSIGNNTIDKNSDLVILKIPNKGMDIGGKFCAVKYLNDNDVTYEYILFLHSKSNPDTRRKYFKQLIDKLDDEFIKNINKNDGYFPDIQWEIVGDKLKMISGNPEFADSNLHERNLLYRKVILKYLGANNNTNNFIEGNCYILSKKVINKLYTDPLLYNILNTETCFDYNWVSKAYNIHGNIYEVYKQFKERKLAPRNEKSFDGYLEHVFERVVLNFCDNYKIFKIYNKINILIRNTYRPTYFKKCIDSILNQDYKNYKVIMCYDDDYCLEYLEQYKNNPKIEIFKATEVDKSHQAFYNLYCNQLLDKVQDGWIMFLDDDDILTDKTVLEEINNNLDNKNNMLFWKVKIANQVIYPENINKIEKFKVSSQGFCFNSKFKYLAKWDGERCGDYRFITKLLGNKNDFKRIFIDKILTGMQHTNIMGLLGKKEIPQSITKVEELIKYLNIKSIYTSKSLAHFNDRVCKKFNLTNNIEKVSSLIFFGLYLKEDIDLLLSLTNSNICLICGGSDMPNIQYIASIVPRITFIAISADMQNRFKRMNIPCKLVEFNLTDRDLFYPRESINNYIYIYDGYYKNNPANQKIYGKKYYDEVIKRLPNEKFIFSSELNKKYEEMPEIYAQCKIGLRLTENDGNANTVQEFEAMDIPIVHNQSKYGLKWKSVDDIIVHILKIKSRYLNIKNFNCINIENNLSYDQLISNTNGDNINETNFVNNIIESNITLYFNNKFITGNSKLTPQITISRNKNYDKLINKTNVYLSSIPYKKECHGLYFITKSMIYAIKNKNSLLYPHVYDHKLFNEVNNKPFFLNEQVIHKNWYNWATDDEIQQLKLKYFPEDAFVICICGRIAINSYPKSLLEAIKILRNQGHNIHLLALTKFEVNPHRLTQNLYDEITSYDWVKSFTVDKKDVLNYFRICDMLASTYRDYCNHVGGSNKIKEYLLCNKPILCSRGKERENELGKDYPGLYDCKTCDTVPPLCWTQEFIKNPHCYKKQYEIYFKKLENDGLKSEITAIKDIIIFNIQSTIPQLLELPDKIDLTKLTIVKKKFTILCGCYRDIDENLFKSLSNICDNFELLIIIDEDINNEKYMYDKIIKRNSKNLILKYGLANKIKIFYTSKNRGVYVNLNAALLKSSGEIVITTSMDSIVNPKLLKILLELHEYNDVCMYKYYKYPIPMYYEDVKNIFNSDIKGTYGHSMLSFNKKIIKIVGLYDNVRFAGDSNFINTIKNNNINIKTADILGQVFFGSNNSKAYSEERNNYINNTRKIKYHKFITDNKYENALDNLHIDYSFVGNLSHQLKYSTFTYLKNKIKILFISHNSHFLTNVINSLNKDIFHVEIMEFKSTTTNHSEDQIKDYKKKIRSFDILWCEWALYNAELFSNIKLPRQILIVRLHAYEYWKPYIKMFNFNNIDLIYVVGEWFKQKIKTIYNFNKINVLDNYYTLFDNHNKSNRNKNIGMVGVSSINIKQPFIGLQIFKKILENDSSYKMFIKGDIDYTNKVDLTNTFSNEELDEQIKLTKSLVNEINHKYPGSLIFCKHTKDGGETMEKFYNNIGYLISCSSHESFHCCVMEAGSCGCIPLIYLNKSFDLPTVPDHMQVFSFEKDIELANFILDNNNFTKYSKHIENFYRSSLINENKLEKQILELYNPKLEIKITYLLPLFNSLDKFEIYSKVLANQDCNEPWELIIAEEETDLSNSIDNIKYLYSKIKSNCVKFTYIKLKCWVPLSIKWLLMIENISKTSICSLFSASDDYYSKNRLMNTYTQFKNNPSLNMYTDCYGFFYNFNNKKYYGYNKHLQKKRSNNPMALSFAFDTRSILNISPVYIAYKWIDTWLYRSIFTNNNIEPVVYFNNTIDEDTYNSLYTDGMNNISVGREDLMINIQPPFYKLDLKTIDKLNKLWSDEINNLNYINYVKNNNIVINIDKFI